MVVHLQANCKPIYCIKLFNSFRVLLGGPHKVHMMFNQTSIQQLYYHCFGSHHLKTGLAILYGLVSCIDLKAWLYRPGYRVSSKRYNR